jgi:photosystem II stability/assembly factor-like uncharacterized protein
MAEINNSSTNKKECAMKTLTTLLLVLITQYSSNVAQEGNFTIISVSQGIKIYTIKIVDSKNGWAESIFGDILITTNGGKEWGVKTRTDLEKMKTISQIGTDNGWSADIYCEVMQSTDCGESWKPYPKKQEEHFCAVYFKDENTGWKVAEEFLKKVVSTIATSIRDNNWMQKIDVPHKCREYYTDMNIGWSVGWCFNNLIGDSL